MIGRWKGCSRTLRAISGSCSPITRTGRSLFCFTVTLACRKQICADAVVAGARLLRSAAETGYRPDIVLSDLSTARRAMCRALRFASFTGRIARRITDKCRLWTRQECWAKRRNVPLSRKTKELKNHRPRQGSRRASTLAHANQRGRYCTGSMRASSPTDERALARRTAVDARFYRAPIHRCSEFFGRTQ